MYLPMNNKGFTLIELLVVVALISITALYAVPSFTSLIANNQVRSTANNFVGFLNYGRSEAVKQGRTVRLAPLDGADWESGGILWVDGDGNNTFDAADTELRRMGSIPSSISLTGSLTTVGFRGNGYVTPAPTTPTNEFSLGVCSSNVEEGTDVFVGFSGRVRTAVRAC